MSKDENLTSYNIEWIAGKTITVMGLGVLGRGVNVAKFLLKNGVKKLLITDLKSNDQLQASIKELEKYNDRIEYVLGRHRVQDFVETDLVVKAAGVPKDNRYITAALAAKVPVKMDASWACSILGNKVKTIGVTGTKGKSSVTHLIAHILEVAGIPFQLGGNVRGQATLPLLNKISDKDILLLELDSWQLQGFHDEQISPNIAVFTNFMPDHLNYYAGMPDYFFDKSAIYRYQDKNDKLVLTKSSYEAMRLYDSEFKVKGSTAVVKPSIMRKDWHFTQPGQHNRLNATQAYQVAKFLDISDEIIKEALETFPGVPGRLEFIDEINGVKFYNDTNATTPDATAASIQAIRQSVDRCVVICGGISKGFREFEVLIKALNSYVQKVILLPGGIADAIVDSLTTDYVMVSDMQSAVQQAYTIAIETGAQSVVMSPAGSSFGLFKNEYDRGDQFVKAVKDLN